MESVLNKLRDTVSATVGTVYQVTNNLSSALPGNPLTREYELMGQVGSAGPGLVFKIYEAQKKSTKEQASLFILEKTKLERLNKKEKEYLFERIRYGVPQLTRLRHPSMLTIQHSIEESRDLIAFATEPVVGSLADFINKNKSDEISKSQSQKSEDFFYDVEIKYGLWQISEGLLFLHKDARILHGNLCPENIIVNRNGIWKISGFDFSSPTLNANEQPYRFSSLQLITDLSLDCQPNYAFTAPEHLKQKASAETRLVDTSADIFSLGMIAYILYNKGSTLLSFNSTYLYKPDKFVDELFQRLESSSAMLIIPEDARKHLKLLLAFDVALRPDAQQISKLSIFQDVLVKTLQYFDSLFQWDNAQKAQFYKNLPDILVQMPKRVKLRRIICGLSKEFVNPEMVPFVLPPFFSIARETDNEEFHTWIVPDLVPVFRHREPIQIGIFLLQNMDFLVNKFKTKPDSLKEHIIPLIYRFLEPDCAYQIQELCLSVIPSTIHLIDFNGCKNMLLPRIKKLALSTKLLSVRVNCLVCLGKILESLEKWLVLDEVLPLVMQMPSREPAVIMSSVGIFKLALNSNKLGIPKEMLANSVIPFLVPLSIESGLSLQQYSVIMNLIREILNQIEEEHQCKLQQLDSIKIKQDSFFSSNGSSTDNLSHTNSNGPLDFFNLGNSPDSSTLLKSTGQLSLNDKERLAFEKEQSKLLGNNNLPLMPTTTVDNLSSPSEPSKNPIRDLTKTLIDSNLNNLKTTTTKNNNSIDHQFRNSSEPSSSILAWPTNPINTLATIPNPKNVSSLDNLKVFNSNQSKQSNTLNSMISNKQTTSIPKTTLTSNAINYQSPRMFIPVQSNNGQSLNITSTNSNTAKPLSQSELDEFLN